MTKESFQIGKKTTKQVVVVVPPIKRKRLGEMGLNEMRLSEMKIGEPSTSYCYYYYTKSGGQITRHFYYCNNFLYSQPIFILLADAHE